RQRRAPFLSRGVPPPPGPAPRTPPPFGGRPPLARGARPPERLLAAHRGPGPDEEQGGKAGQIGERDWTRVFGRGEAHCLALGTTADRPGHVEPCRRLTAAGKDKALQRLEALVDQVAELLEPVHPGLLHPEPPT